MDFLDEGVVKVEKFCLEEEYDKTEYEKILNDPSCEVIRDEFTYDRAGRPIITI